MIGRQATMVRLRADAGRRVSARCHAAAVRPGVRRGRRTAGPAVGGAGAAGCMSLRSRCSCEVVGAAPAEVETGRATAASAPKPQYDPARTSLQQRELAKLEELAAAGVVVSLPHVEAAAQRLHAVAPAGSGRPARRPRFQSYRPGRPSRSRRDQDRVARADSDLVGHQVSAAPPGGGAAGPRARRRRRDVAFAGDVLPAGRGAPRRQHTFGAAATRRSLANRPDGPFGSVTALRPGELVQIDTTPLDVMVLLDDGVPARLGADASGRRRDPHDLFGSAAPARHQGRRRRAAAGQGAGPRAAAPGLARSLADEGLTAAHVDLGAVDHRLVEAAAKPVITPETIVCDRGAVFLSQTFTAACARLGISLSLPIRARRPTRASSRGRSPRSTRCFASTSPATPAATSPAAAPTWDEACGRWRSCRTCWTSGCWPGGSPARTMVCGIPSCHVRRCRRTRCTRCWTPRPVTCRWRWPARTIWSCCRSAGARSPRPVCGSDR